MYLDRREQERENRTPRPGAIHLRAPGCQDLCHRVQPGSGAEARGLRRRIEAEPVGVMGPLRLWQNDAAQLPVGPR